MNFVSFWRNCERMGFVSFWRQFFAYVCERMDFLSFVSMDFVLAYL